MTESGLVVVDKPAGMTSHDVVARVRRIAGTRKVGHAGTLDPMATGVLLLGVNKATRLLGHLTLTDKAYDATIRLGAATTTDDAEGETVATADASGLDEAAVRAALGTFVGDIEQVPSSVSAVKVAGKRAYQLARAGEEVTLPARQVTVHSIDVHDVRRIDGLLDVDVSVSCSSGTYIRALARDLGRSLGVGGHLTALRRTRVGPFTLQEASTLQRLQETGSGGLVAMGVVARRVFPSAVVDRDSARAVGFGQKLPLDLPDADGPVALLDAEGELLALYRQQGTVAAPVAVFV